MADRLKRASLVRLVVVTAVLAFPLLAVGTAQAAIAGANPESTTNRPDLVSATALNSNSVDFCFDKQLNNSTLLPGTHFHARRLPVGSAGDRDRAFLEQTVDHDRASASGRSSWRRARIGDIGQYTVATVSRRRRADDWRRDQPDRG